MSREIIKQLAEDKELMEACKRITSNSDLWKDLFQFTMTELLEKPPEIIKEAHENGKSRAFAIKIMLNQWSGPRTEFCKLYKEDNYPVSSITAIPVFSAPTITADIGKWKEIIKERQYNIFEINPMTIRILEVMEQMRKEDNARGSGYPYRTYIFNYYLKYRSVRKVATVTRINFMSIQRTVLGVKQKIRGK